MDCRSFRKHHLEYLDDTLSGDQTAAAQRHVLACDSCAAHDTLVRRSLMLARSMPTIEPTAQFQERLRARLAECRDDASGSLHGASNGSPYAGYRDAVDMTRGLRADAVRGSRSRRSPRALAAVAAGALLGTLAWRSFTPAETASAAPPAVAAQPAAPMQHPYVTPALMQAMATGNPVWPAAMLMEDAQSHFVAADFALSNDLR